MFRYMFSSFVRGNGEEQRKENYDYDECYADFNDCVNEAEWTKQIGGKYE